MDPIVSEFIIVNALPISFAKYTRDNKILNEIYIYIRMCDFLKSNISKKLIPRITSSSVIFFKRNIKFPKKFKRKKMIEILEDGKINFDRFVKIYHLRVSSNIYIYIYSNFIDDTHTHTHTRSD